MNAILYARFSPRPNASECESIRTQLERSRAYAAAHALPITGEFFDENLSGGRADNRPGLQAALTAVCREKACLIVYSLTRLARSTRDAVAISDRLRGCGADLASLHETIDTRTSMGRFFYTVMAALGELEREQISERTRDAMLRHQANGRRMSDETPYGWVRRADNPALMEEELGEQDVIRRIVSDRQTGMKFREIARGLMESSISCRGRAKWNHGTIQAILRRAGVY